MTSWTHRPTWPADPETRATDRRVYRDDKPVGRVTRLPHGPQAGSWQWSGLWGGPTSTGLEPSLAAALEALRQAHDSAQPELLEAMEARTASRPV